MRYILHSDLNNFYASVECLHNPSIRNLPVVVVGDEEKRHGIVLSKNGLAKAYGIATGETVWSARQKSKGHLVCVPARFELYSKVSKMVKDIYRRYSSHVESFGIDEAWMDITSCVKSFEEAVKLANEIRKRVVEEIGITVSIGVSYNKVFAKLGSDLKKPDAVSVITPDNYKNMVWKLKVEELIYVGRSTKKTLNRMGINTIGELANCDIKFLKRMLGKNGVTLHEFANGADNSAVKEFSEKEKSIGNSTTCPRDLKNDKEVETIIYILAENVAARLRRKGWWCEEVCLFVKESTLNSFERQKKLSYPTNLTGEIAKECFELFKQNFNWQNTIRAVGVRAGKLCEPPVQYNFLVNENTIYKKGKLEETVEILRHKYGYNIIRRGNVLSDADFVSLNPTEKQHLIHPVSFFKF